MVAIKLATYTVRSKIVSKMLGNPRVPAGWDDVDLSSGRVHILGTIIGIASGVKRVLSDPKDETSAQYALVGDFEAQPANLTADGNPITDPVRMKPVIRSGVLWLPTGLHEQVVAAVCRGGTPGAKQTIYQSVPIKVRIATEKASHGSGYSYVNEVVNLQMNTADPLDALRGDGPLLIASTVTDVDTMVHDPETGEIKEPVELSGDVGHAEVEGEESTSRRHRGGRGR